MDTPVHKQFEADSEEELRQKQPEEVKESRSEGSVKLKVYRDYFRNGGSGFTLILIVVINLSCQLLYSGGDAWLSYWPSQEVSTSHSHSRSLSKET